MNMPVSAKSLLGAGVRLLTAVGLAAALPGSFAVGDLAASGATSSTAAYRIVAASNRDGVYRAYSLASDGSQPAPLLAPSRRLVPFAVSANGRTIAYVTDELPDPVGPIFVSGGNGSGLRRVDRYAHGPALSPDGRMLAYTKPGDSLWIGGTNGRGRRRLARKCVCSPNWSPSGKALVYDHWILDAEEVEALSYSIVVQPLRGTRRVIVRVNLGDSEGTQGGVPKWSPNGRWIAYNDTGADRRNGLWVVRPDGTGLHRVAPVARLVSWSPRGDRLAVTGSSPGVSIVDVRGRRRRVSPGLHVGAVAWSPDGRSLLVSGRLGDSPNEIWSVGADGQGLRRLTNVGSNSLVGVTRLAPSRPAASPIAPSERVADARSVEVAAPIVDLSADGGRVAFLVERTKTDCHHAALWSPGSSAIERFTLQAPCWALWERGVKDVELAGTRAAWLTYGSDGYPVEYALRSATVANPDPRGIAFKGLDRGQAWDPHLRGDGDMLVFNDDSRLVRIGVGKEKCQKEGGAGSCTTLKRGAHSSPVDSVSGELIAVREREAVAILDLQGNVERVLPFSPGGVRVARLDGGRLVVWRFGRLEAYDVESGTLEASRPVEAGYRLVDVDGGVAVLVREGSVLLLVLADGTSRTITPGPGPIVVELEPDGLYYAHRVGNRGRLVFLPRSEVFR